MALSVSLIASSSKEGTCILGWGYVGVLRLLPDWLEQIYTVLIVARRWGVSVRTMGMHLSSTMIIVYLNHTLSSGGLLG